MNDGVLPLAVALGIGLLLGTERERRMNEQQERGAAGVRTFALVALLGGLSIRVGGDATAAVALAFVGLAAVMSYVRVSGPGLTTEVALVVAFLLGALAQSEPTLAAGIGVATAIVLAGRDRLHALVRDTLSERELHDALLFAACALIVLPLVPDRPMGPNDAFNPATVWRLVVIVMAVQALGYIALRTIGLRFGLALTGLIGGFVSSTATIGTMGARAARSPHQRAGAVAGAVASSVATIVLLAIVVGAVSLPTLRGLALPFALAGIAAIAYAAVFALRAAADTAEEEIERGRAFDLRVALLLAGTVSIVLLVAGVVNDAAGATGVVLGTAVAGLADSQSAAISAATLAQQGQVAVADAELAILVALTTNTLSKAIVAFALGKRAFAARVYPGLVLILAGAWGGWVISHTLGL